MDSSSNKIYFSKTTPLNNDSLSNILKVNNKGTRTIPIDIVLDPQLLTLTYFFPSVTFGTKYSRMDQIKFVEDSL